MKKQILSLSITAVIALASVIPTFNAEACNDVLVQNRFALANCMIESAASIAATAACVNGCQPGVWNIEVVVPEVYISGIPIQGLTLVEGNGDYYELNGSASAFQRNNVICQVSTTSSANSYDGQELTYSTDNGNFYVDAVIDQGSNMLCIKHFVSSADVTLGLWNYQETNTLVFQESEDVINAEGIESIFYLQGKSKRKTVHLCDWMTEEEVVIPNLGDLEVDGFELEKTINETCKITIKGSVLNLEYYIIEGVSGGLTISGTLEVQ
jgi:hypothetical protein